MQDRRAHRGCGSAYLFHRFGKGGALDPGRSDSAHKCVIDEVPPPISGEEPDVREFDDWRFTGDLVTPSPRVDDCAVQAKVDETLGSANRCWGMTSTTTAPVSLIRKKVRNVPSRLPVDLCRQQKGLGHNPVHAGVEVGIQQPRKLQPGLVDHMTVLCCRPIGAE